MMESLNYEIIDNYDELECIDEMEIMEYNYLTDSKRNTLSNSKHDNSFERKPSYEIIREWSIKDKAPIYGLPKQSHKTINQSNKFLLSQFTPPTVDKKGFETIKIKSPRQLFQLLKDKMSINNSFYDNCSNGKKDYKQLRHERYIRRREMKNMNFMTKYGWNFSMGWHKRPNVFFIDPEAVRDDIQKHSERIQSAKTKISNENVINQSIRLSRPTSKKIRYIPSTNIDATINSPIKRRPQTAVPQIKKNILDSRRKSASVYPDMSR